jgi:multiple sugar transport system substrate-binding protein
MAFQRHHSSLTRGATRISRRGLVIGGTTAAASATFLSGAWNPRTSMAAQPTGELTMRIFPFGPGVEDLYGTFVSEFEAENPGITVAIDLQPWDNRYPKLLADLAAGQGPDVFFITTDVLIRFSEAKAIAAASDHVSAEVFTGYEQTYVDEVGLNDKTWFVPYDREVMLHVANLDLFEQAGLDASTLPVTWDDVRNLCQAVQDLGDPLLTGFGYNAAGTSLNTTFYPYLRQAGGFPISEDGTTATFNSPEGVETLNFIVELFANEWADPAYLQSIEDGQDPFTLGTQALSNNMFVNGLLQLRQNAPDMNYSLSPILTHKEKWGFGGMRSWALSESSANKEAAGLLLEFLARPENAKRHGELSGTFPALTAAREGIFADDPEIASLAGELQFIFGEQKHKYGRDLMPLVVPEIQAAIIGEKESQQALDDAATAVNELFAQG